MNEIAGPFLAQPVRTQSPELTLRIRRRNGPGRFHPAATPVRRTNDRGHARYPPRFEVGPSGGGRPLPALLLEEFTEPLAHVVNAPEIPVALLCIGMTGQVAIRMAEQRISQDARVAQCQRHPLAEARISGPCGLADERDAIPVRMIEPRVPGVGRSQTVRGPWLGQLLGGGTAHDGRRATSMPSVFASAIPQVARYSPRTRSLLAEGKARKKHFHGNRLVCVNSCAGGRAA
jgi:hypothetical protein